MSSCNDWCLYIDSNSNAYYLGAYYQRRLRRKVLFRPLASTLEFFYCQCCSEPPEKEMLKAEVISGMNKALGSCYYVDTLSYGFQHVLRLLAVNKYAKGLFLLSQIQQTMNKSPFSRQN